MIRNATFTPDEFQASIKKAAAGNSDSRLLYFY